LQCLLNYMKQRICHISYNHQPFDDRIYWKELLTLQEAGYETIHICVGDGARDFITPEGIRIIQIKRVVSATNIWLMRIRHILFGKNETIKAIFEVAKQLQAAVYHYHDLQLNALVPALQRLPQKPRLIYDCHEAYHLLMMADAKQGLVRLGMRMLVIPLVNNWELKMAKRCDYVIANYPYVLSYFKKKAPDVPGTILYNYSFFEDGLDAGRVNTEKKYDFIYSGHITKNRGIHEIIEAVSLLRGRLGEATLLLIGDFESADFYKEILQKINDLGMHDSITVHPLVPFSNIGKFYSQSRVGLCILYPTKIFNVAIPVKLFEYMSFGLPVIFANHGPAAEIISKERCGLLVDAYDSAAICKAMYTLMRDENCYQTFSENGKRAATQYHWNNEKSKLLSIYNDLLGAAEQQNLVITKVTNEP
jgi:glycosyltransferase involved in cell wall biosynthesis